MAGERKFVTEKIRRVLLKEYFMKEIKKARRDLVRARTAPVPVRPYASQILQMVWGERQKAQYGHRLRSVQGRS